MSVVYRCKVRKPNGEITDGCGHEFAPTIEGPLRFDDIACPVCPAGFLREKSGPLTPWPAKQILPGDSFTLSRQVHGGPLVAEVLAFANKGVDAHLGTEVGLNVDRLTVLRAVLANVKALAFAAAGPAPQGITSDEDELVATTLTLLRSLLPAEPAADKQAQTAMAEHYGSKALAAAISVIGEWVSVSPERAFTVDHEEEGVFVADLYDNSKQKIDEESTFLGAVHAAAEAIRSGEVES